MIMPRFLVLKSVCSFGLQAKTERPDLRADRQATAEMTAAPYTTNSKTYIHISKSYSRTTKVSTVMKEPVNYGEEL